MKFFLHIRDYENVRLSLIAAGLWERDPLETVPPPPPIRRWHPVSPTRPLTAMERQVDVLMREVPESVHAG